MHDIQLLNIARELARIADALEESNKMFASEFENEAIEKYIGKEKQ